MRRTCQAALLLSLAALALLFLGSDAAAQDENTVSVTPPPPRVFSGLAVTIAFEVQLNNTTLATDISDAAVYFDAAPHGPGPFDYAQYAGRAGAVLGSGTNLTAQFDAPALPGSLYLVVLANVSGSTLYNASEWSIEVREHPAITLNASASSEAAFVGRNWTAVADIAWAYGDALSEVWLAWDSAAHNASPPDIALYPNATLAQSGVAGGFGFVLPAGQFAVVKHYRIAARVDGVTFVSAAEANVSVVPEPIVARDSSPVWAFVGRNITVRWSVIWPYSFDTPSAALLWDSNSHFPVLPSDYPTVEAGAPAASPSSFSALLAAPGSPGAVYFLLRVSLLGEDFFVTDLTGGITEFAVEVRAEPQVRLAGAPDPAFIGRPVPLAVEVIWPYAGALSVVAVHFDSTSHGDPPTSGSAYANEVNRTSVPPGTFNLTLPALSGPGTVYFALRAAAGGEEFLSASEYNVSAVEPPAVALAAPPWLLPGTLAVFEVQVAWSAGLPLDLVAIYFDGVSHAGAPDPGLYASSATPQGGPPGTFTFTLSAPGAPGTLFALARARVGAFDFFAPAEVAVRVVAAPSIGNISISTGTGIALYGQQFTVSWTVDFGASAEVSSDFRWDSASHAPVSAFTDYPNASTLVTRNSGEPFSAGVTAPAAVGTMYGMVRVVLQGRNFYSAGEAAVVVLAPPTLELLSYPAKVQTGEPIPVAWAVRFSGDAALIPHTAIHWGLVSKASQPPSLANYPGVGGPFSGNETNVFAASIPAQNSPGEVYFIVHAVVNGVHFYLPQEFHVTVEQPPARAGGGFLPALGAPLVAAAALAAFALHRAGRRRS